MNTLSDAQYMNPSTDVFVEQILQTVNYCSLLAQRAEKHKVFSGSNKKCLTDYYVTYSELVRTNISIAYIRNNRATGKLPQYQFYRLDTAQAAQQAAVGKAGSTAPVTGPQNTPTHGPTTSIFRPKLYSKHQSCIYLVLISHYYCRVYTFSTS